MKSKVLLIDDSVTIHRVIDLSIDIDRYDIVKVFSKEDAALKMQSEQYDYILLDNKLDNIIISEYIKELKAAQPSASIILLVGAFDRFDESDLEKTGADDYLVKPFDSQSLNEKLSSDADMMPAGIVEKIAEADFARDNDDYIAPAPSVNSGEVVDGFSKKEYLENLEEVQPDDLTDNGYTEDLDTAQSLEFDKQPKESEEAQPQMQEETIQAEEQAEEINDTAENSIIEESPKEDITVAENNEEETVNVPLDEAGETVSFEEPAVNEAENGVEPFLEQETEQESEDEVSEENKEVLGIPATVEEMPLTAEAPEEVNTPVNTEEIEIPDNITAVHNPVLPDIDNMADISDEYIMQDNLEEVDNQSQNDMLDEFPDFPDVDETQADETQDNQDTENNQAHETDNMEKVAEELPKDNIMEESASEEIHEEEHVEPAEEQETLLVDDDDWLSDMPSAQEENTADVQAEEPQLDLSEDSVTENQEPAEESISNDDNTMQEEAVAEETQVQEKEEPAESPVLFEESAAEENEIPADFDMQAEESAPAEAVQDLDLDITEQVQEDLPEENIASDINTADDIPEMPSLDEVSTVAESVDTADENSVEDMQIIEETTEETVEETSFEMQEEKAEETAMVNEEPVLEETSFPVQKEEVQQEPANIQQTEVKQAKEDNSHETSGRFGGITVTISRDEIIAMLGNAVDKHFLEETVKEVIASNMKEIVRNIVPAIAEKYIKEEIERLKNDE